MKCKKTNSSKTQLYLEYWYIKGPKKNAYAGMYSARKVPVDHLQSRIKETSEYLAWAYSTDAYLDPIYIRRTELALDYLYAELGRRANRAVVR